MTTDDLFLTLYEAGCTRDEIMSSDLSHLLLRSRAYERRMQREEAMNLALVNEVRTFKGADPIDPHDLSPSPSQEVDKDEAARHELLRQMDFDDSEELGPDEFNDLG
jgi:hypothetical protein